MSRVTRILTVLALAVAVVVAFTPASQAGQKAEVRWFQWKTTEVGEKLMNELKAAFEKEHPDITLTLVDNPFQGFHDKALTLFQAQKLADVLMVQVDWVAEYADLGMLEADSTPGSPRSPRSSWGTSRRPSSRSGRGKQYYLPLHSGCVALYWNTEIFKNAGIAGPPKTWDEYVQIAKKVTNPEKKIFATTATLQIEPPTNMTYDIYPLILQAGGDILDAKANKAAFNSPAGVKAIEWYVDLVNKHKVAVPGVLSNGEKEKRANFATGNIAMMFEGPWGVAIQKQVEQGPQVRHRAPAQGDDHRDGGPRLPQYRDQPGPEQGSGLEVRALDLGPGGQRDVGQGDGRFPGPEGRGGEAVLQGEQAPPGLRAADAAAERQVRRSSGCRTPCR